MVPVQVAAPPEAELSAWSSSWSSLVSKLDGVREAREMGHERGQLVVLVAREVEPELAVADRGRGHEGRTAGAAGLGDHGDAGHARGASRR